MVARLKAWLRALPLRRRVAYLTTVAVALAVAVTSVAVVARLVRPAYTSESTDIRPGILPPRAARTAR